MLLGNCQDKANRVILQILLSSEENEKKVTDFTQIVLTCKG